MRFSACCWLSLALASAAFAEEPSATPARLADVLERMASSSGVEVFFYERKELALLAAPADDGLLTVGADGSLLVTPVGRLLVRNLAMPFDAYLAGQRASGERMFSKTV